MNAKNEIRGVYCAAATPIHRDLSPNMDLLVAHCRSLIAQGCDGIALLGTTGEANSFSQSERKAILEQTVAGGVNPDQLMPGTGCCAVSDTVELTRHALSLGVNRVVMLPPFYYKTPSEDGLFAAYAEAIERVGDARLRVVLYHIPQMSAVPITMPLIERLIAAYPDTVVGIKDSSGDFENMKAMVRAFPGFSVLAGADPLLRPLLEEGGTGCITATSNLVARELAIVYRGARDAARKQEVDAAQERIVALRTLSGRFSAQIATIKAMLVAATGVESWSHVRPPLVPLTEAQRGELGQILSGLQPVNA